MENNILKPTCESKAGRVLFYVFEIAAAVIAFLFILEGLVWVFQGAGFATLVSALEQATIYLLLLYGIGRVIDLLYKHNEK